MNGAQYQVSDEHMRGVFVHAAHRTVREARAKHWDSFIASHDARVKKLAYQQARDLLNEWLWAEGEIAVDRGLHILDFLASGRSPEEYGLPKGASA